VDAPHMIPLADDAESPLGCSYDPDTGTFTLPEPPEPQRIPMTRIGFLDLLLSAGGATNANLAAARADANLAALWVKLEFASDVNPLHPATEEGLTALEALGYLPNGKQAVLDAWPTA
jgi:hypothetical protein